MISTPEPARVAHEGGPGADEALLVGERDAPPGLQRGMGRPQPGRAADRGQHDVGVPLDRLEDRATRPAPHAMPEPDRAAFSAAPPPSSARAANRAPSRRAMSASASASRPPTTASTRNASRWASTTSAVERPTEPVAPRMVRVRVIGTISRSQVDEEHDARGSAQTAQKPSRRSMTPPWPGIRWLESLRRNAASGRIRRDRRSGSRPSRDERQHDDVAQAERRRSSRGCCDDPGDEQARERRRRRGRRGSPTRSSSG